VDSKKAKANDEVTAKTAQDVRSNGMVVIPRGTKLVGHVTEAHARGNGQADSALGIVFDHAVLKNGQQVPLNASIQALAAVASDASAAAAGNDIGMSGAGSGGGMGGASAPMGGTGGGLGGVGNTVGNVGGAVGSTAAGTAGAIGGAAGNTVGAAGGAAGNTAGGTLNSTSHGIVGMTGYSLSAAGGSTTQGSVITSSTKNVKLDSGTQMVLQVGAQPQ
jgi:hypothetical protein